MMEERLRTSNNEYRYVAFNEAHDVYKCGQEVQLDAFHYIV